MGELASILRKTQLLANLGMLVLVSIISTAGMSTRNALARLFGRIAPHTEVETRLLVNTYELLRERLRDSLKEIEKKNQQLEESGEKVRSSRDFLQAIIDSLDEDLMVLDSDLRITQINRSLRLKHKDEEVIGRHCYEVSHGLTHPCSPPLVCPASQVWQTGTGARAIYT